MKENTPEVSDDPVVEANRKLLLDRSRVGVNKYQTTLAGAGLSRDQLLQHALEEALDLSNYLQALLQHPAMLTEEQFACACIDAAEEYASDYNDDTREAIKTDVMNAFYAGIDFILRQRTEPAVVRPEQADVIRHMPGEHK